jgi:hypothetical protein
MLVCLSLIFCMRAEALIYDDFSGVGIDTSKWSLSRDPDNLFFQPGDGRLHFGPISTENYTGNARIVSVDTFGPGFFSMEFYDFTSTNLQIPGSHQGAFAALGLTDGNNFVRVIRDQNGVGSTPVGVFEVNYNIGSEIQVHYLTTNVTEGQLGLYYDGTKVTFYYRTNGGWQHTGWSEGFSEWSPNWTSAPWLYIQGYDLFGRTSFSVDNVEYTAAPEPPILILLGSGLLGLIRLRKPLKGILP